MQGFFGKTMCAELVEGDLMVVVHRRNTAPDAGEWSRYCECVLAAGSGAGGMRTLVVTRGLSAAPNAKQRTEYNKSAAGAEHKVAVVHDGSPLAHAALIAMSWFNPKVRAFHQRALADALHYLGLAARPAISVLVDRMDRHMGADPGQPPRHEQAAR